jgi:hypothetical protein
MRNFFIGLVVGALGMIAVVALGWIHITSPRTSDPSPGTTISVPVPQNHDVKSARSEVAIDQEMIAGRIMQIDKGAQQILVQSRDQRLVYLKIQNDTRIRIHDRNGTFADLEVSQPITASYMYVDGQNRCRTLTVQQ